MMGEVAAASFAAVGTTQFKNAEAVNVLVMWALEALRHHLSQKGARIYLPSPLALPAPLQDSVAEPETPEGPEPVEPDAPEEPQAVASQGSAIPA